MKVDQDWVLIPLPKGTMKDKRAIVVCWMGCTIHLELSHVKDAVISHALEVQNTEKEHYRVIFDLVCKCLLKEGGDSERKTGDMLLLSATSGTRNRNTSVRVKGTMRQMS